MFTDSEILRIAKYLNIDFSKFSFDDFKRGIVIELEHGLESINTNVTNDDLLKTAKIALAHLNEYPNYYNKDYGLLVFEDFLKSKLK
ncbi:MAG: hypothetical protein IJY25_01995 [Bacilli bacterium]|nr:hypothetical protein [Bacilli bacterium]